MNLHIDDVLDSPAHPTSATSDSGITQENYVATRILAALVIADAASGKSVAADNPNTNNRKILVCLAADYTEDLFEELYLRRIMRKHPCNEEVTI